MIIVFLFSWGIYFVGVDNFYEWKEFKNNTKMVYGKLCIKERAYYNKNYNLNCCPGLKPVDTATFWSQSNLDEFGGICSINLSGGIYYCLKCGDGICGDNENYCNCREDCPNKEDYGGYAPLLK